ncbi:MAG: hypothetical protein OEY89_05285 [Gammaproteobacteria bacterium]|nr:hypothetical protein [Gammaproteobacteria bacterium]
MFVRRSVIGILVIFFHVFAFYFYFYWEQNKSVELIPDIRIQQSLQLGIGWLAHNEDKILAENNAMLWWMLQQSALLTHDKKLVDLFAKYQSKYLTGQHNNMWLPLFNTHSWIPVRYEQIRHFPYYNKHFIYSLSCDQDLAKIPEIAEQDQPDFCDWHPLRPACVTHQLMGIRMQQRRGCAADAGVLQHTVEALQQRIVRQLTWDPRVVDVYLQRVMMLLESGAGEQLKPIWITRVVEAQSMSGGWGNFEPIVSVGEGKYFGFTQSGFGIKRPQDTFHATIQGVYIMSLLSSLNNNH